MSSTRYLSVDVECVSTGKTHNDRGVCSVAVVDSNEETLLHAIVKPDKPVVSYLTPISGVRPGDLDDGKSLPVVIQQVKAIQVDIELLGLVKGTDYSDIVELSKMFETPNPRYGNMFFCTLKHKADILLGKGFISEPHSPVQDARASIRLFNTYRDNPDRLKRDCTKLLKVRPATSFYKAVNYQYEGVCLAGFYPAKCICNAPTKKGTM